VLKGSDPVAQASQGVLVGSLGKRRSVTKTCQGDGEDSVGNNPAKNELDQIANREFSGVIAQHRINLFNDLGLASHGL